MIFFLCVSFSLFHFLHLLLLSLPSLPFSSFLNNKQHTTSLSHLAILSHITPHHITPHHITSHHITTQQTTPHHTTQHHTTPHHTTPHHTTSHHTTHWTVGLLLLKRKVQLRHRHLRMLRRLLRQRLQQHHVPSSRVHRLWLKLLHLSHNHRPLRLVRQLHQRCTAVEECQGTSPRLLVYRRESQVWHER